MAKFRATINFTDGSHELRFYWSDKLTKEDIEHMIEHDPRADLIQSYKITYDETYKQTELASEISAIVDNYKQRVSDRISRAFKLR